MDIFKPPLAPFTGKSANSLHFQVYLLEGLVRWNENRARAAVEVTPPLVSYKAEKVHHFNRLAQKYLGKTLVQTFSQPGEHTGKVVYEELAVLRVRIFAELIHLIPASFALFRGTHRGGVPVLPDRSYPGQELQPGS